MSEPSPTTQLKMSLRRIRTMLVEIEDQFTRIEGSEDKPEAWRTAGSRLGQAVDDTRVLAGWCESQEEKARKRNRRK